jgi:hypothetical protein
MAGGATSAAAQVSLVILVRAFSHAARNFAIASTRVVAVPFVRHVRNRRHDLGDRPDPSQPAGFAQTRLARLGSHEERFGRGFEHDLYRRLLDSRAGVAALSASDRIRCRPAGNTRRSQSLAVSRAAPSAYATRSVGGDVGLHHRSGSSSLDFKMTRAPCRISK